jgi:D-glycero-D-manno-heptose 1,7-bisphosphate phosphatase
VINLDSPDYIKSVTEFVPIAGALEAIAQLHKAGLKVAVCTNQSAVGRGLINMAELEEIHAELDRRLKALGGELAGLVVCPHQPDEGCDCRKPKPGMLLSIMQTLAVAPADTLFVGDSLRDLEAARAARCTPVLVRTGNGAALEAEARRLGVDEIYDDLQEFGAAMLARLHNQAAQQQ